MLTAKLKVGLPQDCLACFGCHDLIKEHKDNVSGSFPYATHTTHLGCLIMLWKHTGNCAKADFPKHLC